MPSYIYGPVKRACAWWRAGLVRLPSSVRYLGTFSCQGGLPWTFRNDRGEYVYVGEGSVSNRSSELIVLVPEDCAAENTDVMEVTSNRALRFWNLNRLLTEDEAVSDGKGRSGSKPEMRHISVNFGSNGVEVVCGR